MYCIMQELDVLLHSWEGFKHKTNLAVKKTCTWTCMNPQLNVFYDVLWYDMLLLTLLYYVTYHVLAIHFTHWTTYSLELCSVHAKTAIAHKFDVLIIASSYAKAFKAPKELYLASLDIYYFLDPLWSRSFITGLIRLAIFHHQNHYDLKTLKETKL